MAEKFPKFAVLKAGGYAYYMTESDEVGYVSCTGKSVFDPYAKIEVESAKSNENYVHLRFCASNKYWALPTPGSYWIVASSDQPEEDTSKQSCTLFEPVYQTRGFTFRHIQTGGTVAKDAGSFRLRVETLGYDTEYAYFSFVDWDTLVKLPKRVCFKGSNDLYVRDYWQNKRPYLQVSSKDGNRDTTSFEVHLQVDGHLRIKSVHYDSFWRRSHNWILSDSEDESDQDKDTLFWPVKIDKRTIALRNEGNKKFIIPLTIEGKEDCLNAASPTITNNAKFIVEELVLDRSIYNVRYRMEDARIFDETPFVAGVGTANNESSTESILTVLVKFEESTSYSFTNSISVTLGVAVEFTAGIPSIAEGKISVSAEVTNEVEWNRTTEKTKSVEAVYAIKVPPKSRVQVSYTGTRGTCNIPFSYVQRDKSSTDGQIVKTHHVDGVYNGVSCYNYHFEQPAISPL